MIKAKPYEQLDFEIPDLDDQKRQFIDHINNLIDNIQNISSLSDVLTQLSTLAEHANHYFRVEEIFLCHKLEEYEFSDHRMRHLFFENYLRTPIIQASDDGQCDTKELITFITDWMNFHIQHLDKRLYEKWDNREVLD